MNKLKLTGIMLILLIAGCTKDEDPSPNDPAEMHLRVSLIKHEYFNGIQAFDEGMGGEYYTFNFTDGFISLQKLEFEGNREVGGMYLFENYPVLNYSPFIKQSNGKYEAEISDFDMPQGVYDNFRWDIYLKEIDGLTDDDEIESIHAGLILKGIYERDKIWFEDFNIEVQKLIPFIFAIDDMEKFCFRSLNKVVVGQSNNARIYLLFDWPYVFNSISWESFEGAEISGDSLNEKIIISNTINTDLYEIMLYRLCLSTRVSVLN